MKLENTSFHSSSLESKNFNSIQSYANYTLSNKSELKYHTNTDLQIFVICERIFVAQLTIAITL